MVACDTRDLMAFFVSKIGQGRLIDEAERMFVMPAYLDHHTGVVQKCGSFKQTQRTGIQIVQWLCGVKKLDGETHYLASVRPIFYKQSSA